MQYHKLAWRNIWRNKRRTLLTAASVVIAVFFSVLIESLNEGMWDYLIDNEIEVFTGHLEIHQKDYWENKSIENAIVDPQEVFACLDTIDAIKSYACRVDMFVLISWGEKSRSCVLWGIEPYRKTGSVEFKSNDNGVWIGEGLSRFLNVSVGDSVILMGHSFFGRKNADIYPVIYSGFNPIPDVDRRLILAPINLVRNFGDLNNGVTNILVTLHHRHQVEQVKQMLVSKLDNNTYEVKTWQEILAGRMALYRMRDVGVLILKLILYFIVGFGILGTVLMTNSERKREYGILLAIGMKKKRLIITHLFEMLYVSTLGVLIGIMLVYPIMVILHHFPIPLKGGLAEVMWRYNMEPIIIFSDSVAIIFNNALVVFNITVLVTLIPVYILAKLNLMKAIRS